MKTPNYLITRDGEYYRVISLRSYETVFLTKKIQEAADYQQSELAGMLVQWDTR